MNKVLIVTVLAVFILPIIWVIAKNTAPKPSRSMETKPMETNRPVPLIELTPENAQKVIAAPLPTLLIVDFYAEWCEPCKAMKPIFEEVARQLKDKYSFAKVNIDQCPAVAHEYTITSIPTIAIFSNGKLIDKITGRQSKEVLLARINQAVAMPQDLSQLDQKTLDQKLIQAIQMIASLEDIKRLIDAGADVNAVSEHGITPLMFAIIMLVPAGIDVTDMVKLLVDHGASTQFVTSLDNKKMDAHEYITALIERGNIVLRNCQKLVSLLKKETSPQDKNSCTSERCTL